LNAHAPTLRAPAAPLRLRDDLVATVLRTVAFVPCDPDRCQVCGMRHHPSDPHVGRSVYYHVRFELVHGRSPTTADAVAHCPVEIRAAVRAEAELLGRWTEPPRGEAGICEPYFDGRHP
jgi:hypothetical protein